MLNIKSKVSENKQIKKENLLASAYELFIRKGVNDTSISDITDNAKVAKGTFYLYFIDKWDIYEKLIIERSRLLFEEALININNTNITNFEEKIIILADYIINTFKNNIDLLKFIGKNLSLGIYNNLTYEEYNYQYNNIKENFEKELQTYNKKIKDPSSILFIIIQLISSTCYDTILNCFPTNIDSFKDILFEQVKKIISQ